MTATRLLSLFAIVLVAGCTAGGKSSRPKKDGAADSGGSGGKGGQDGGSGGAGGAGGAGGSAGSGDAGGAGGSGGTGGAGGAGGEGGGPSGGEICGMTDPVVKTCKDTIACAENCTDRATTQQCIDLLTDGAEKSKANAYWDCADMACFDAGGDDLDSCICTELCTDTGMCGKLAADCVGMGDLKSLNPECGFHGC